MLTRKEISNIYNAHKNSLYLYIFKHTGNSETAEDIFHDCFEKLIVYSKHKNIVPDKVKSLLFTIAHNLCVNYIKKKNKISFIEADEELLHDTNNGPLEKIEADELIARIYEIVKSCDPLSQSVFIMLRDLNMRYEEIAENLGISAITVRRKFAKILIKLRKDLEDEGFFNKE